MDVQCLSFDERVDPVALLQSLVSIPSVNPMGREIPSSIAMETRLTDFLECLLNDEGVPTERHEVAPGRANLLARIDAASRATVLLDAHQDTVPIDGMTIPPFDPKISDGRLYGRGSCDVKGGMAAMLAAFLRMHRDPRELSSNVVLSLTVDEESTTLGINHLVNLWSDARGESNFLEDAPDCAVVAEPTDRQIVVAHRGATRWKIRTRGKACHSSQPELGENAIYRMGQVIAGLERFASRIQQLIPPHPLCGGATLSVGRITGGVSVNTVPDICEIEIDRRVTPGEDESLVIAQVREFLAEELDFDLEFEPPWLSGPPLPDDRNGWVAQYLKECANQFGHSGSLIGVPYGTHASRTARAGVPSVVYGPGSIAQAHTKNEWISISEVQTCSQVYEAFCRSASAEDLKSQVNES